MKNQITLLEAKEGVNGLVAKRDAHNAAILNLRKVSVSGRDNGLIIRFNTKTGHFLHDGTTWRVYVNFCEKGGEIVDLHQFVPQLNTLKPLLETL